MSFIRESLENAEEDWAESERTRMEKSYANTCCQECGAADGWEWLDRVQISWIFDSIFLAFLVWLVSNVRIKWYPITPIYVCPDPDFVMVPCTICRPSTENARQMSLEKIIHWCFGAGA